jgi:glyoxylase-like metal-dependent hydrolase (beta-lactamase superfamily II)
VAVLAASHCHVYGALWRVAERFRPKTIFQEAALPFCQAIQVSFPFDNKWPITDDLTLIRTSGHTPDHTVLHDARHGRLYCGDALKFTFPGDGQTVGEPDTISCHKAYDAHIPLTHGDARRYLAMFEPLEFDTVITPWEVVTKGGKDAALSLLYAQLRGEPFADPFPLK